MKQFMLLHVPALSFFSRALYREVWQEWKGVGLGYLLLLIAACWVPLTIQMHIQVGRLIASEGPWVISQVPDISLVKGEVFTEAPQPYFIKNPSNGNVLVAIDTTGSIKTLDEAQGAFVLITRKQLIMRQNNMPPQVHELAGMGNITINREKANRWLGLTGKYFAAVFFPFAVLFSYIYRVIQALIYGVVVLILASYGRVKMTYPAALRLAVVSATPAILIGTLAMIAGIMIPVAGLWYFIIALFYLQFGVRACGQNDQAGATSPT